ncbi:hypothetical protein BDZ89DRAFT_452351 [Hymenopellis radicata]|nr:hypothetical protein BDZ89DRAFT_452351 [Hymenopellis radicata]
MLWTSYSDLKPVWQGRLFVLCTSSSLQSASYVVYLRPLPEIVFLSSFSSTFGNGRDWRIWTHIYVRVDGDWQRPSDF